MPPFDPGFPVSVTHSTAKTIQALEGAGEFESQSSSGIAAIERIQDRFRRLHILGLPQLLGRFLPGCHSFSPFFGLPPWAVTSFNQQASDRN